MKLKLLIRLMLCAFPRSKGAYRAHYDDNFVPGRLNGPYR